MKTFLLGLLCGLTFSSCVKAPEVQVVPVLTVQSECPAFQTLPYVLDGSVSDDDLVCVGVWPRDPLRDLVCMKVGELKALIVHLKKT